ncbi:hypothetical protein WN48_08702 [Eufriesea mexicana]|nr:hypothetical protein WN48_08702 [Eufriesea mexicana]
MPRNLSEADRKKNQFDKEERVHLLAIMKQYAPLLDKSASTLARKKIWTTIEDEFKKAGFIRKTSAQLKKYWQNYKYHCKKATAFGKENKKYAETEVKESLEWNRYQVFVENRSPSKFSEMPEAVRSLADRLQKSPMESNCRFGEAYENDGRPTCRKLNSSDAFIDLSRVKMERNDEEATSEYRETEEKDTLGDLNLEEDSLEEKKEIFVNEERLVSSSSSSSASECKTVNRIVVSNAKISNNSVTVSVIYPENDNAYFSTNAIDGVLDVRSNGGTLSTRRTADYPWIERTQRSSRLNSIKVHDTNAVYARAFGYHDLVEHGSERSRVNETSANGEEFDSLECNPNDDLSREKQMGEFSKEDRDLIATESDENDANGVKTRNSASRNDRFESRGYVFLTDYRNRLKHRLLLQQLETEEKRLKVKIAEMAVQEVQLRIKALSEDMRRTEELHRLRLARAAAANVNGRVAEFLEKS